MPDQNVGVVLNHDDPRVVEDVGELLDAEPDLFVAATSMDAASPGAVVVCGGEALLALGRIQHPLVALADGDAIGAARAALSAGAFDIVAWPAEASRLPGAIRRAADPARSAVARGKVIAVAGARGGAGCSTVVAGLASILRDVIVIDLDGGQRMFAPRDVDPVAPAGDDLGAILAPHIGDSRCAHLGPRHANTHAARALAAVSVVDAGRVPGGLAGPPVFASADARVLVVPNDVASVRAAAEIAVTHVLVRRVRRDGVAVKDIAASIGIQPVAVMPEDRALARAVDLGRLPSRPSSAMRAIGELARALERA